MNEQQRETYLLFLQAERAREAVAFREKCYGNANAATDYRDKRNEKICSSMTIRIDGGEQEIVYACGDGDLVVHATNPAFLEKHPDLAREYYVLSMSQLKTWRS